jgi:multicomponent Na+:H+ antiporter subunit C
VTGDVVFPVLGATLFGLGFAALVGRRHLLWRIIAVNIMASGVSVLLLTLSSGNALSGRASPGPALAGAAAGPDPVPQAMVLTGIVVMVAATGLALALAVRIAAAAPGPGPGRNAPAADADAGRDTTSPTDSEAARDA